MEKIKVLVSGAAGKMGREVIKAIIKEKDMEVVGAVDINETGIDAGTMAGIASLGVRITPSLVVSIQSQKPEVVVDFTSPSAVMDNIRAILKNRVHAVVGTTGITEENLAEIKTLCEKNGVNAIIAPNFAIGAVLMMKFAKEAVKYMPQAEIIEFHHETKVDKPSGTAIKTTHLMGKEVPIHSVRLPGLVAHQEVIFGGLGQTLTIRHDSISRESFMPGVLLAIRKVKNLKGLTYGLEHLL